MPQPTGVIRWRTWVSGSRNSLYAGVLHGNSIRACTPAYAYGEFWEPEYPGMPVWLRQRMVNYGNRNTQVRQRMAR